MKVNGHLKKWDVKNIVGIDGDTEPKLTITMEIPFRPTFATSLGKLTTGSPLSITIEKSQGELDLE